MSNDITQRLNNLFERDMNGIDIQKDRVQDIHKGVEQALRHASELSDIDADLLLTCIVQATFHHANISWYEALDLFRAIYVNKKRIEDEQAR